jgi:hypothetical protein
MMPAFQLEAAQSESPGKIASMPSLQISRVLNTQIRLLNRSSTTQKDQAY